MKKIIASFFMIALFLSACAQENPKAEQQNSQQPITNNQQLTTNGQLPTTNNQSQKNEILQDNLDDSLKELEALESLQ